MKTLPTTPRPYNRWKAETLSFLHVRILGWGVNLESSLTAIGDHERQRFNELRGTVVSRRIFIRSQSLIAR
jgi:hypothetical protein